MIWVLGKNERFDMAWRVVRRMYRRSILNGDAMVVLMERSLVALVFDVFSAFLFGDSVWIVSMKL